MTKIRSPPRVRAASHLLRPQFAGVDLPPASILFGARRVFRPCRMADSQYGALPDSTDSKSGHLYPPHAPSPPSPSRSRSPGSGSNDRRRSLASGSDSDSDVSYRDVLDTEPFDEKVKVAERFQDEPNMEEGEEGYSMEPSRVGFGHHGGRCRADLHLRAASAAKEISSYPCCSTRYTPVCGLYRCSGRMGLLCAVVLAQIWKSAYHPGSYHEWDVFTQIPIRRLGQGG